MSDKEKPNIIKPAGAMAGATLISRILGLGREMCYARFMGDSKVAGAFLLAFMIPNLFRRLLGEGALTAAFIPIFKDKEINEGKEAMWRSANAVVSGLVVFATLIIGLVLGVVSAVLAWGELAENTKLMLELLRWMFPYMMFVSLAAVVMGMLNSRGHFFVPALAPALMNVVLIISVLVFAPMIKGGMDKKIFALAVGVLVAGMAQFLFQLPLLRKEGFRWHWVSPWRNKMVSGVVGKMVPAAIGAAAFQINLVATTCMGFWVADHVVASFSYAVRLMELPQGLFGVSLAAFLLPALSSLKAENKHDEFKATLAEGLWHVIYINILMMCLLMVLAEPMVRLLFERGEFTADSTRHVSYALKCLAPALVFYSISGIMIRAFYARGDVKTPMKISLLCLVLNLGLVAALIFSDFFPMDQKQGAFGIANSLTACVTVILLGLAFERRWGRLDLGGVTGRRSSLAVLLGVVLSSATAMGMAYFTQLSWGIEGLWAQLGGVLVPMATAGAVYFGLGVLIGVPTVQDILNALGRKRRRN